MHEDDHSYKTKPASFDTTIDHVMPFTLRLFKIALNACFIFFLYIYISHV